MKLDEMSDAHRQLLQSFMSRGIIDAREVRRQFEYACQRFTGKLYFTCDKFPNFFSIMENLVRRQLPISVLEICFTISLAGAEVEANMDNLVKVITAINNNIRPMHLEIKKAVSEDKEGHFYGLVSACLLLFGGSGVYNIFLCLKKWIGVQIWF